VAARTRRRHRPRRLHRQNPFSAGQWQPSGTIRAVDSYQPGTWYDVTIERDVDPAACIDETPFAESQSPVPRWPAGQGWPDYFMFGDPHANFYEGQVHYDDIRLEVWRD
jgi:hypothetical protein